MPARRRPTIRLLLLAALTVTATLTLTACDDGEGLRDEGPSSLSWDLSGASEPPPSPSR
ncbi:hypothetical protein [Streptomyces sp. NPDC018693]|uniref:hypothetical protein n=1 Tax=unclassified Streptomyces TaxID=2593676 RepID=UPI0037907006